MNELFDYLKDIFNKNGFRLYMIGSTSRDYLLNKEIKDYDFVTDATPLEVSKFLDCNLTFSRFGCVKYKKDNKHVDIVTLRKEFDYEDNRHPNKVEFIKDVNEDYKRRDLTINAIYIDENYKILDISKDGYNDLLNKKLHFIGDPLKRIKEDPLRILRAKRFALEYNLDIDESLVKLLEENKDLLNNLSKAKIDEEMRKLKAVEESLWEIFLI